jgi:predicted MarR family transcription regulator
MDGILIAASEAITPGSNARGDAFQDPDIFSPHLSNSTRPVWQTDFLQMCRLALNRSLSHMRKTPMVLDIEDTHIANYAVKKLEAAGLVRTGKTGKEKMIETTDKGLDSLARYAEIRERLLVDATNASGLSQENLSGIASSLRALSGYNEQAARSAATL